jgi:protein-tyrosine phosphatase
VEVAGVRNFGWVVPGKLARGEQPPFEAETFAGLRAAGVDTILSLREDAEKPRTVGQRELPVYSIEHERRMAEEAGLRSLHLPCVDFRAPRPDQVGQAMRLLDEEIGAGRVVMIHCLAGVGRTSATSAAWYMANGGSSEEAADRHIVFMDNAMDRAPALDTLSEEQMYLRAIAHGSAWWGLITIAAALGKPIAPRKNAPKPVRPPEADGWETWYERELAPWRERA